MKGEFAAQRLPVEADSYPVCALPRNDSSYRDCFQEFSDQLAFESLMGRMLSSFVGAAGDEIESVVQSALSQVADFMGADCAHIAVRSQGPAAWSVRHEWRAQGVSCARAASPACTCGAHPKSSIEAPLGRPGELIAGSIALRSYAREVTWLECAMQRLAIVGNAIASLLQRGRAEESLRLGRGVGADADPPHVRGEMWIVDRTPGAIIGESQAIRQVLAQAEQVARTQTTVLLLGETGVGKELVAQAIHDLGTRATKPMIKVNCAGLPSTLVENELFGREKGAYTGALTRQEGRFEAAEGSTILLDEIGDLPPELQTKLLRVLQDGQFERLGSTRTIQVNVRVIAATNRDLAAAIREGRFRQDLYYRLAVFPITVPPLRERPEDIPALVWSFIKEFEGKGRPKIASVPPKTMELLKHYAWPGNIRELRNVIEHAMIISSGPVLRVEMPRSREMMATPARTLEEVERNHILSVLEQAGWRVRGDCGAAAVLGLKPTTLSSKMERLGIRRPKPNAAS